MTIRDMLALLIDAPNLDATIEIRTHDGCKLGGIHTITTGYLSLGDSILPRLVLTDGSWDVVVSARRHAVVQADGDPVELAKLHEAGVIS